MMSIFTWSTFHYPHFPAVRTRQPAGRLNVSVLDFILFFQKKKKEYEIIILCSTSTRICILTYTALPASLLPGQPSSLAVMVHMRLSNCMGRNSDMFQLGCSLVL